MKAIVCTKYGSPEVLKLQEVPKPVPKRNEILIKIHATTCHIGDVRIRSFNVPFWQKIPIRLYLGILKPKRKILGMELSGDVEAIGSDVKRFKKGDQVLATSGFVFGAYAEYICLPEDSKKIKYGLIALKPSNLSYNEAAAGITTGGLTALSFLRAAKIKKGQHVMIYGASGSVGTYAVQLAKYYGAVVTGVCSKANVELVRSIGADKVIDYESDLFPPTGKIFDVVFDAVDKLQKSIAKAILKTNGLYLNVVKNFDAEENITSKDLIFLKELAESSIIKPIIDRSYNLEDIVDAHKYVEKGHKKGHVVITI